MRAKHLILYAAAFCMIYAVFSVACNRTADVGQVSAYLMRSAGYKLNFKQRFLPVGL